MGDWVASEETGWCGMGKNGVSSWQVRHVSSRAFYYLAKLTPKMYNEKNKTIKNKCPLEHIVSNICKIFVLNSLRIAYIIFAYTYPPFPNSSQIHPSFHTHLTLCPHFWKLTKSILCHLHFWVCAHPKSWCKIGLKHSKSQKWEKMALKPSILDTAGLLHTGPHRDSGSMHNTRA